MRNGDFELVVCGGGLSGVCAAISASRLGLKTALIQDRPVLGGNSSSEIRVQVSGAANFNAFAEETGIIRELLLEAENEQVPLGDGVTNSLWDLILYKKVRQEKNLSLFLNTSVREVMMKSKKIIKGVRCIQLGSEKVFNIYGRFFIDATGDGSVAALAGAEYRIGREARKEFNESLAPEKADKYTMGSSILFCARDTGKPTRFIPPSWAIDYPSDKDLPFRDHKNIASGYWWIEIGAPFDTIEDNEKIRDELLQHLLGVWDHIKNHGNHGADNYVLDWIGMVPGKRESRRIIGDYILNENDIKKTRVFSDRVAYGGWFIDLHTIGGILAKNKPPEPICTVLQGDYREYDRRIVAPYSIPFRCLYSKNIKNLLLAGRDISVTHVALGSTRVMATCAVIGQAVGTAAHLCVKHKVLPENIYPNFIKELQQSLLKQDCFIPEVKNEDSRDFARKAKVIASSESPLLFEEGKDFCPLDIPRGQLFPFAGGYLERINLLLKSNVNKKMEIRFGLRKAKNIWDYESKDDLITSVSKIPSAGIFWIPFEIRQKLSKGFYWVWLEAPKQVCWAHSKQIPFATVSLFKPLNRWHWDRLSLIHI